MPEPLNYNSSAAYFAAVLKSTSAYSLFRRISKYAKRFLLVTRIVKYAGILIAVIETGAVIVVFLGFALLLIPIAAAAVVAVSAADFIIGRKFLTSGKLEKYTGNKKIAVVFLKKNAGSGFAESLSADGFAVIAVSTENNKRFVTYRFEGGVLYVRYAFFYRLKRIYFGKYPKRMIYIL